MGTRREARERALSLVYESDVRGRSGALVLDDLPAPADPLTESIVRGVDEHGPALDALIDAAAEHWRLDRMAMVDRALIRIGCFELVHCPDVPTAVILSEAVELAKRFSTADSGRFVNGILARVALDVRGEGVVAGDDVTSG